MVFNFILYPCDLDESGLSIGRVNEVCVCYGVYYSLLVLVVAAHTEGSTSIYTPNNTANTQSCFLSLPVENVSYKQMYKSILI